MSVSPQLPYYSWWDQLPDYLKTKTQLDQAGLKPGGPIRARIAYGRGRRARDYALYDEREAVAKRTPTVAQRAALEKAQLALRTCQECGRVVTRRSGLDHGCCGRCIEVQEQISRKADQDESIVWARQLLLNDPASVVVLDTETTDLHGRLCEIAVIDLAGRVLLDTLVNPETPILATHIHGITDAMVADAPTFAQIAPALREQLRGKRVAAYNADYDQGIVLHEIARLLETQFAAFYAAPPPDAPRDVRQAYYDLWGMQMRQPRDAWMTEATWIDVMEPYSQYCGEWDARHGSYRWQPLAGSHRAINDCYACFHVIHHIATTPLAVEARLRKRQARVYYVTE